MTEEDKSMVRELYESGWIPETIAEELELNEAEVIDYCSTIL